MDTEGFRRVAMRMPLAAESSHMGQPDFRVGGKIFATLPRAPDTGRGKGAAARPSGALGMVKLTPEEQRAFVAERPRAFVQVAGEWGKRGATYVVLGEVDAATLRRAMAAAWGNAAPKGVVEEFGRLGAG